MIIILLILTAIICSCLLFITFTESQFYSSAISYLFIFEHKKWKLYQKAKKTGVKTYLYPYDYEIDADTGDVPEFYLYPLVQEDGGIHYYLYGPDYQFITDNFYLTERL